MTITALKRIQLKALWPKSIPLPMNLRQRDKIALSIAGGAVALFLLLHVIILPVIDRRANLRNHLNARTVALQEFQKLAVEYKNLLHNSRGSEDQIKKRPKGFTLFSYLDSLAGSSGIKQNIIYMKPATTNLKNSSYLLSIVEMKIQSLTLEKLVNFLNSVEKSNELVWIKRMSLSKDDNKAAGLITAVLQVETFQK